jgi:hypothetical protein
MLLLYCFITMLVKTTCADAALLECTGVNLRYGRAMGHDEAVTPVFPNSA